LSTPIRTTKPAWTQSLAAAALLVVNVACAPVQVLTGTVRPPIAASSVVLYGAAPPNFEQIALLCASRTTFFGTGGQRTIDQLVRQLSAQAAKLGANGIILDDLSDERSMSLGTGIGSDSYTHNADISLGFGGLIGVYKKTGNARAIYVPRE
jgi:murein endopeptidase